MQFDKISLEPAEIKKAQQRHKQGNRSFQGIPSLECSNDGRLFAVWYSGGETECNQNYVCLAISDDDGQTWTDAVTVIESNHYAVRVFDPEIWFAPDGRLFLFYAQGSGNDDKSCDIYDGVCGVWMTELKNPGTSPENFEFTAPIRIADGIMMNKPTVLSDGTWAFPCALWSQSINPKIIPPWTAQPGCLEGEYMVISADKGKTFSVRSRIDMSQVEGGPAFDEHSFIQQNDGTIRVWSRVSAGLSESISSDLGQNWSSPELIKTVSGPSTRFFLRKLRSGNWLLIYNDCRTARKNLTAYLSDDEGKSWKYKLLLDERLNVSYPDGVQAPDGSIYIIYDRERYNGGFIHMVKFYENDLLSGAVDQVKQFTVSQTRPCPAE